MYPADEKLLDFNICGLIISLQLEVVWPGQQMACSIWVMNQLNIYLHWAQIC